MLTPEELYSRDFKVLEGTGRKSGILQVDVDGTGRFNPPKSIVDRMKPKAPVYRFLLVPDRATLVNVIAPHLIDESYPAMIAIPGFCEVKIKGVPCNEIAQKVRSGKFLCAEHREFFGWGIG